jgi:hypothetical protein
MIRLKILVQSGDSVFFFIEFGFVLFYSILAWEFVMHLCYAFYVKQYCLYDVLVAGGAQVLATLFYQHNYAIKAFFYIFITVFIISDIWQRTSIILVKFSFLSLS